jgi:hypothetical protein
LDFQPPKLWAKSFLSKLSCLRYFVIEMKNQPKQKHIILYVCHKGRTS